MKYKTNINELEITTDEIKELYINESIQEMQPADVYNLFFNSKLNLEYCDGYNKNPQKHYPEIPTATNKEEKIANMIVMDAAMRWSNDENITLRWLTYGIPDGASFDELEYWTKDGSYEDFLSAYNNIKD